MISFPDAEVAEDDVQNVLDVDPAGQAAESVGGNAEFLSEEVFGKRRLGTGKGGASVLKGEPLSGARDERRLGCAEQGLGLLLQRGNQISRPTAGK